MGGCISWLAYPSDATGCAAYIDHGGVVGGPLRTFSQAHVTTDTVDTSRSRRNAVQAFEYVTSHTLVKFVVLLQAHAALFTLRSWSYVSCLRYMVPTDALGDHPSDAVYVYAIALCAGGLLLVMIILFVLQQNGAFWWVPRMMVAAAALLCCGARCRCCRRLSCCKCSCGGCCDRDSACYQCLERVCCLEDTDDDEERRRRRMRRQQQREQRQLQAAPEGVAMGAAVVGATAAVVAADVVFSSTDEDRESSGEEDDEAVDDTLPITSLRWRYPLTRTIAQNLVFGSLNEDKTKAEREQEEARWDNADYAFMQFPVDAEGVPLETEAQLAAASVARRGNLPPDPELDPGDRAKDEHLTFMQIILALWIPNAVMASIDWYFYSKDPNNPAYNGFFWVAFVLGFVTALGPPWYYWQKYIGKAIEAYARWTATSPYSKRFHYRELPTITNAEPDPEQEEYRRWLNERQRSREAAQHSSQRGGDSSRGGGPVRPTGTAAAAAEQRQPEVPSDDGAVPLPDRPPPA